MLSHERWLPYYLPHWSSRERAAARYELRDGCLRLQIHADQEPWSPEYDGEIRVSSLQTGLQEGQHRFHPDAVVRERQETLALYTPHYGRIEVRLKANDDPQTMVALWLIGHDPAPEHSGEICVCEIFGRDVAAGHARVGMGVHPFGDPRLVDDFEAVELPIDAREFHLYAADWAPTSVAFFVDGEPVRNVVQSPAYPMQLMLGIYEFPGERAPGAYPKELVVDFVRGFRPVN
jgi:Glycosyl hydrolases family 16